jgi:formylglycine-generating enzyme required for sulfatase activity
MIMTAQPPFAGASLLWLALGCHHGVHPTCVGARSTTKIPVPAGTYSIGCSESGCADNPVRVVSMRAFRISVTEVTLDDFLVCVDARQCPVAPLDRHNETGDPSRVAVVDFAGAESYCAWVGGRLPSPDEWEVAARGPDHLQYPWGNQWDDTKLSTLLASTPADGCNAVFGPPV